MTDRPTHIASRYEVVDVLGRGGTAVVYRVRDPSRAGELALKQLVAGGSARDRHARASFEREFKVLAELRHPSVVEVYDFGIDAAGAYYTMELLDGGDLSASSPLPYRQACELVAQICSSLSVLHSRGFVHRDVSPRNVRFTQHGTAKLIDFGAMVPFGPCTQGVGTPGFVAPEVMHHLPLDARTDVFSVGATLYYALTGRRPFAARTLAELSAAWLKGREPFTAGDAVPPALEALIAAALQMDPALRPRTAFELRQRLAAISGQPLADSAEISQAYLSTPTLVGRDAELRRLGQHLRRMREGDGLGLFVQGPSGSGRSRLLDTCVLELMTSGAIVLRAEGRGARPEPFATAHRLADQLLDAMPGEARACAVSVGRSERLFDGTSSQLQPVSRWAEQRYGVQDAIEKWFTRVCQLRPLAIAVDDVERVDDASLALLVALADAAAGRRLLVMTTSVREPDVPAPPAVEVLRTHSTELTLSPLTAADTEALFTSVFSGAPHAGLVSDRIHKLSAGNPREAMRLAQHMLEHGSIQFADGAWVLPSELAVGDLPASAEDVVRKRVNALPAVPRHVVEAQSLALDAPWTAEDYRALDPARDAAEVLAAVETLRRIGLVVENDGAYTLSHPGVRAAVLAQLPDARRLSHQCALAAMCERTSRPVLVEVMHRLAGEMFERGLERLATVLSTRPQASALYERASGVDSTTIGRVLERALEVAIARARPAREQAELRRLLIEHSVTTDNGFYYRHAATWLAQLERDSGLADYRAEDPEKPATERLELALQTAVARYTATPESERVYRVDEAIGMLARYVPYSAAIGARALDSRLVASLPALLEPFAGLSPLLHGLWQNVIGTREMACYGRYDRARETYVEAYRRLEAVQIPEMGYVHAVRHAIAHALALIDVSLGNPSAEQWVSALDDDPLQRVTALYLRRAQSLFDGDTERAEAYHKQAEILAIQASARQMFDPPTILELDVQVHARDLTGVKQVVDRLARMASHSPGWTGLHHAAQASFHRLRGDLPAARVASEAALALETPDRTDAPPRLRVWAIAAEGHIAVLEGLGLLDEAFAFGQHAYATAERLEVTGLHGIARALAWVEARLGRHVQAAARLDALIEQRTHLRPSLRALDYEARARVALWAKDAEGALQFARLAIDGAAASGGMQQARRGRLLEEAQRAGLRLNLTRSGEPALPDIDDRRGLAHGNAVRARAAAVLGPLPDAAARAHRSLSSLAEALGAAAGQLYYAHGETVTRTAALGSPDPALDRFVAGYWRHRKEQAAITTVFTTTDVDGFELATVTWSGSGGTRFLVIPLSPLGEAEAIGLVALAAAHATIPAEYWLLSAGLSARLIASGDVRTPEP